MFKYNNKIYLSFTGISCHGKISGTKYKNVGIRRLTRNMMTVEYILVEYDCAVIGKHWFAHCVTLCHICTLLEGTYCVYSEEQKYRVQELDLESLPLA